MNWTRERVARLSLKIEELNMIAINVQQLAGVLEPDAPGRDELVVANELIALATAQLGEVLEHAQSAWELTEAIAELA